MNKLIIWNLPNYKPRNKPKSIICKMDQQPCNYTKVLIYEVNKIKLLLFRSGCAKFSR